MWMADVNATRQVLPTAWQAYVSAYQHPHRWPQLCKAAAAQILTLCGAPPGATLLWSSGGTEAAAQALLGCMQLPGHIVTSCLEHAAVMQTLQWHCQNGYGTLSILPANPDSVVQQRLLKGLLKPTTQLVSVMLASHETGVVQPVAELVASLQGSEVITHCDATAYVGKLPLNMQALGVDLLSFSGHKIGAVAGIGALLLRPGLQLQPLFGDTKSCHNPPGAVSLAAALQHDHHVHGSVFRDEFERAMQAQLPQVYVVGGNVARLPNTSCMYVGVNAMDVLLRLDLEGVAASYGSACSSGSVTPWRSLLSMGYDARFASSCIRFSFGADADVAALPSLVEKIVRNVRAIGRS